MTLFSRRYTLKAALASALVPAFGIGGVLRAATRESFSPPMQPMRLSRSLDRDLGDGAMISVTRHWLVQFEAFGRGYKLNGEQEAVAVNAPPSLASFARLEEARIERGLLPLLLDQKGQVTGTTATGNADDQIDEAIRQANDRISLQNPEASPAQFLASLRQSADTITQRIPRDLFFPMDMDWETRRKIAIPGGDEGEIVVRFVAALADNGCVIQRATRTIETVIGTSRRDSREEWTLLPV